MGQYVDKIIELGNNTALDNYQIAEKVGCTPRTVRRILGPYKDRMQEKLGVGVDDTVAVGLPKVLIFDIETSPMETYVWRLGKQYVGPDNVIKDWSILSWSAKWLFQPDVMSAVVTTQEAKDRTEESIIHGIWNLLDQADIIIAHNGKRFDTPKLNTKFILHGFNPPRPYQEIDTKQAAYKHFDFASTSLKFLNRLFNLEQKFETTYGLWVRAVNGDASALKEMVEYNAQDVVALEELYLMLRPWIKSHPNMNLYVNTDKSVCPNCGFLDLHWNGTYVTPAGKYKSFRCADCGAIGRSRFADLTKADRKRIVIGTAR